MYHKILVPVDLNHASRLTKSIGTAAQLADKFSARAVMYNLGGTGLGKPAESPEYYAEKLRAFADEQSQQHQCKFGYVSEFSDDPAAEFQTRLHREISQGGYDLVVMASHVPGFSEYIFSSHGGNVASHSKASVMIVRDR